jgi:hypothetical protein
LGSALNAGHELKKPLPQIDLLWFPQKVKIIIVIVMATVAVTA